MDSDVTVELDYDDGFREGFLQGFLQGFMASYAVNNDCERDDCPRGE
jgi:hypothetical protein